MVRIPSMEVDLSVTRFGRVSANDESVNCDKFIAVLVMCMTSGASQPATQCLCEWRGEGGEGGHCL